MLADLSAAIDVYSDWIDACDLVAKDRTRELPPGQFMSSAPNRMGNPAGGYSAGDQTADDDLDDEDAHGELVV